MIMTENEALEELKTFPINCLDFKENQALQVAITALEKLKQYRAIGTVEEFKALKEKSSAKKEIVRQVKDALELFPCDKNGNVHICPNCNNYLIAKMKHCMDCGQALKT